MKILFSIIFNALTLFLLEYLLNTNLQAGISVTWKPEVYIIWWILLWLINVTIKPLLKILSIPLFFVFLWLVIFLINWIVLWLFDYIINKVLMIPWMSYSIVWWINFIIAVAIFTILNMVYSLLFSKK
jgi:putative membrane protein